MIRNSNIDFDIGVPNSNASHLKPLKLKGFTIAHLNIRSLVKNRSISTLSPQTTI